MINDLIWIMLYLYVIGMVAVLFYYLFLYWYSTYTAKQYNMKVDNWELEDRGMFLIFCPIVNICAAVALWVLVHKPMRTIEQIIIISIHPDMQDPPEDEDIW